MRAEYGHDDARHLQSAPGQPLTRRSPRKRRKSGNAGPFPSSARVWSRSKRSRRCRRYAASLRMTTSWPRPELAAGPVCQQFRERDAGPAVSPAGAGSSMERAARRRTARRTVGAGILPQNGPGRQAEHRGLSWIWENGGRSVAEVGLPPRWLRSSVPRRAQESTAAPTQDLPAGEGRTARGELPSMDSGSGIWSREAVSTSPRDLELLLGARGRLADNRRQAARPGGRRPTAPACRRRTGAI